MELETQELNWILSQIAMTFSSFKNIDGTYAMPLSEQQLLRSMRYKLRKEMASKISLYQRRADGRVEWVCKHGVGHSKGVHGCDGCCGKPENKKKMEKTTDR